MLKVNPDKSTSIIEIKKTKSYIELISEKGTLRLVPKSPEIIRVMYTERGEFIEDEQIGLIDYKDSCLWSVDTTENEYILVTDVLRVHISKISGSITYCNLDDEVILSERDKNSHIVEDFESFKMIIGENTVIEKVKTPDGDKYKVKNAEKKYDKNLYHTKLHLEWQDGEALYGLGQHEEGDLNLRGTVQYLHQANMKIAIPMFVSNLGYGVLMHTYSPAIFRDDSYGSYIYTEADNQMDYFFIYGAGMNGVVKGYRKLTGKANLLPKWAYGYIQSQEQYETQEEVVAVGKEYRNRGIGLDGIVMDWNSWPKNLWGQKTFHKEKFSDPKKMTDALHENNLHFMISIWPNMSEASENYKEFLDAELLLPATNIYDALSKEGRKLYWKQAKEGLFQYGVDAWWCDSSEPFTPEWAHNVKPTPERMYSEFLGDAGKYMPTDKCNAYGVYHAKTMYDGQKSTDNEKRVINLTRNGYLGQQRYSTILWSGDISATWDTFRMQIPAGLNFCASGLPYWTMDSGAFFVKDGVQWFWSGDYPDGNNDLGYRELATRWYQYAAFIPIFRGHGTDVRREIWEHAGDGGMFYDSMVKFNKLRYSLMPYIYSVAGKVWEDDDTMMKMLAFDFSNDENVLDIKDQFMFGPSIMACPVTTPMYYDKNSTPIDGADKSRIVYLPKGCDWYDFWTGTKLSGGQYLEAEAAIDKVPLYVKAGSIIVTCEPTNHVNENPDAPWAVNVYSGADAEFTLYEDAGDGYGYESGEYMKRTVSWNEDTKKVDISKPVGDYNGACVDRKFNINQI